MNQHPQSSPSHFRKLVKMRLLNATTLRVESIPAGSTRPEYAILSHRWTDDEVSFQEIHAKGGGRKKRAFAKIKACCEMARRHGLSYVWVDTCCINQDSSAELSEAINSMFQWYREAKICYAYLWDATGVEDFLGSEWFDRGWTLQELVAPAEVQFYASDWTMFGTKTSLSSIISKKTGIDWKYLQGKSLNQASVAERMSWAAKRTTSKPEDMSYCLLGIFDIQMPLLYGEGLQKAFSRLQSLLIKETADLSWLAWNPLPIPISNNHLSDELPGVFARSPADFADCRDIVVCDPDSIGIPMNETNLGIEIKLPIIMGQDSEYALLNCRWRNDILRLIAIPLVEQDGQYFRSPHGTEAMPDKICSEDDKKNVVLSTRARLRKMAPDSNADFFITELPYGLGIKEVYPPDDYEPSSGLLRGPLAVESSPTQSVRLIRLRPQEKWRDSEWQPPSVKSDYLLMLWFKRIKGIQVPFYRLGQLQQDCALADLAKHDITLKKFVRILGRKKFLRANLVKKHIFGKTTYLVKVKAYEYVKKRKEGRLNWKVRYALTI